jgi:hypothetical protein
MGIIAVDRYHSHMFGYPWISIYGYPTAVTYPGGGGQVTASSGRAEAHGGWLSALGATRRGPRGHSALSFLSLWGILHRIAHRARENDSAALVQARPRLFTACRRRCDPGGQGSLARGELSSRGLPQGPLQRESYIGVVDTVGGWPSRRPCNRFSCRPLFFIRDDPYKVERPAGK